MPHPRPPRTVTPAGVAAARSVSPLPIGASNARPHDYPKGGYVRGMFHGVESIDDFASILDVPVSAIALVVPLDVRCRSKNCPHNAIKRNFGHCPAQF